MKIEISGATLEVYNPSGTVEVSSRYAPRLDSLKGKTIAELSNFRWEAARTFPVIRELLQKRFPDLKIIPFNENPSIYYGTEPEKAAEILKKKGCDGVIVGNAA